MKRVIIVFKDKSDVNTVESVGGIVIDSLNGISRLLIADVPEEKINIITAMDRVERVVEDREVKFYPMAETVVPHLLMDGASYIQVPQITYNRVVMDVEIDKSTTGASRYYFDNRTSNLGTAYFYTSSTNNEVFSEMTVKINGTPITNNTNVMTNGGRYTLELTITTPTSNQPLVWGRNGLGYHPKGKIYSFQFYNNTTLVADYQMSTGTTQDQSGNGHHAVLTGGQFVGVVVVEKGRTTYVNPDGNFNWSLINLKAKDMWDRGLTGSGTKVAILDQSFPYHYYMNDYKESTTVSQQGDNKNPHNLAYEGGVHGLECASFISSRTYYTNTGLTRGLASEINMYVVKLFDWGGANITANIMSINWCIEKNIDIVSMSMISDAFDDTVKIAVDAFYDNGGVIFMSSGNQNGETTQLYNLYDKVILVGGVDENLKRWVGASSGSNYSNNLDFMTMYGALNILTSKKEYPQYTDETSTSRGTSYSCPLAVGMFCLYKDFYKDKTNMEIVDLMRDNAMKIDGRTTWDKYYGHGLLQPTQDMLSLPRTIRDNGLNLNGLSDYIDSGSGTSLNLKDNFSMIFDLSQNYGSNGYLISRTDSNLEEGSFFGIHLGHKGSVGARIYIDYIHGTNTYKTDSFPLSIGDEKRRKLAVVFNYPNINIYIDGLLIGTISMSGSMANAISNGNPKVLIGTNGKVKDGNFSGVLYGLDIYNKSLTSSEVQSLYNANSNINTVLRYRFDGGETTIVNDLSGNNNHGTIHGALPMVRKV